MVDITERLEKIKDMIDKGGYFAINRGHQYGKTTSLNALESFLTPEYLVINLDFQLLSKTDFSTEGRFVSSFAREMYRNNAFRSLVSNDIVDAIKRLKNDYKSFVLAVFLMFGFVKVEDGAVVIANRIFETRLYNDMLTSEEMKSTPISKANVIKLARCA